MGRVSEAAGSRRTFLGRASLLLAGAAFLELFWILFDFLRPRKRGDEGAEAVIIVAGPIDRFEPGSVTAFPNGKFYLARLEDGGFLALGRECTHLGCTVPWVAGEKRFVCPCHASAYDIRGEVLSPPAPRALDFYPVRIENRIVKVDIHKPLKRSSFQTAQVTRP